MDNSRDFERVFRLHDPTVRSALRRAGVDRSEVDDLCQETFMTAHRRRHRYRPECSLPGWLRSIARWVASNHRRGEWRRKRRLAQFSCVARGLVDEGRRAAIGLDIQRLLATLPAPKRKVVELRVIEGLSVHETAAALGLNPHTVRSRLLSARVCLRQLEH